ncbi:acyl-CoA dehydrogenase family protein [Agrobacterium burrii]|uniref:Acyl-CoA/acyl-ACP dehydrogenase n=1 Tax=Agrobacterium burrii TaxID=2815339 RepID=A0ABS3ERV1_9HYPH|nr:acyl-CoA dehydrogenase family protein [Agrobacterium burrii]MBO0134263.1 acyl-CoA/acyl-ACP dehydrogenase [Agrobacterium burrii]
MNKHFVDHRFLTRVTAAIEVARLHAEDVDESGRFPSETVAELKRQRLLGIHLPKQFGGEAATLEELAEICACLGAVCSSSAMIFAMHQVQVASLAIYSEPNEWHDALKRRIAADQLLLGSSTTEAGVGGDLRNSSCAVVINGNSFTLEKVAPVISYGLEADMLLITARRNPDASTGDQVLVAVERKDYTLEKTHHWNTLGMRGTRSDGFVLRAAGSLSCILPKPFSEIAAQSMLSSSHILWSSTWYGMAAEVIARSRSALRKAARTTGASVPPGTLRLVDAEAVLRSVRSDIRAAIERASEAEMHIDSYGSAVFQTAMNNLKVTTADRLIEIIAHGMMIIGVAAYRNTGPLSLGRLLRDAYSAPLMISNDRIRQNNANLVLLSPTEKLLAQ